MFMCVVFKTQVMPFADVLDYAQFTAYIDPDALVAAQDNAINILEARAHHLTRCIINA